MDKNWTPIFTSGNLQNAELIRSILAHNDIQSVIVNHQDSLYKFGDIEVCVHRDDVVKATFVLKENESPL